MHWKQEKNSVLASYFSLTLLAVALVISLPQCFLKATATSRRMNGKMSHHKDIGIIPAGDKKLNTCIVLQFSLDNNSEDPIFGRGKDPFHSYSILEFIMNHCPELSKEKPDQ